MKSKDKHVLCNMQKGMTLLEVIVSFLVVGFGLAMTVSMLQASNRYGVSAEYRAIAMREMQSIVEQMRANPLGFEQYVGLPLPDTSCNGKTEKDKSGCTAKVVLKHEAIAKAIEQAGKDLELWKNGLSTKIPKVEAKFTDVDSVKRSFGITIHWMVGDENQRTSTVLKNKDTLKVIFSL